MNSGAQLNIAQRLRDNAARWPDKEALFTPRAANSGATGRGAYQSKTFRQLDDESDAYAHGLSAIGIVRGTKTILMVKPSPELFTILFALFKIGAVPVVVDPGMGIRRMLHCYREVGADAFIGIPVAHVIRTLFRRTFSSLKTWVTVGARWGWGGASLSDFSADTKGEFPVAETATDELLMINFTTGSTGPAKGVEYTHGIVDAMLRGIETKFGHTTDDIGLAPLPLFGIFDLLIGSATVLPPSDPNRPAQADPLRMLDAINSFEVTTMFASPAFLERVFGYALAHGQAYSADSTRLGSLKTVISGGAPVSARIVETTTRALRPDARMFATYGATEALPIAAIESRELAEVANVKGRGTCVGTPIAGLLDARIMQISEDPISIWSSDLEVQPGHVGEIAIAGPIVSPRYHGAAHWNTLMKVQDGDKVWHRTGDLGAHDETGRIWFAGRKSQRLETPTGPLYTVQLEELFNAHPDVARTALVGVGDAQLPVLCVELLREVSTARRAEIETELKALGAAHEKTRAVATVLFHPSFPVDIRHNAKINREALRLWAAATLREQAPSAKLRRGASHVVPLGGWLFIAIGLFIPLSPTLHMLWWIDIFLSVVVHSLQLVVAWPLAKRAGYSPKQAVLYTLLLGGTWWKPLVAGRCAGGSMFQ